MSIPLIYSTVKMLEALLLAPPRYTFLRDRYFPTDPARDIFSTEDVLMDIKQGNRRMAPVVLPRKKGITVAREGYRTMRMTPPFVAPQRTLTLDDLESRGFGEAMFGDMSAEEREGAILGQDLIDLALMHDDREEDIASKCLMNNGYVLRQYADKYGGDEYEEYEIQFFEGAGNPGKFTPATPWDQAGATIYADLCAMVRMLTKDGKPVQDFVASPDVIDKVIMDDTIYKMLDNRRMNFGEVKPESLPEGASYFGQVSIAGHMIGLFAHEAQFTDDADGVTRPVLASGDCFLAAPGCGRKLYGAVKQLEEDDHKFHTYAGERVPKYMADVESDVRTLRLASRPLLVPKYANPTVSANVFA